MMQEDIEQEILQRGVTTGLRIFRASITAMVVGTGHFTLSAKEAPLPLSPFLIFVFFGYHVIRRDVGPCTSSGLNPGIIPGRQPHMYGMG